jgi:uncharacterized repeat protein (TIGR01451 family)
MTVIALKESRQWIAWLVLSILLLATLLLFSSSLAPTHALAPEGAAAQADLALDKDAFPLQVTAGDLVTYTVTISNSGQMTATVETIVDTLDARLSFDGMLAAGDIVSPPLVVANTLTWTGPFTVPPTSTLTLRYQVQTASSSDAYQACNSVAITPADTTLPQEMCVDVEGKTYFAYLPFITNDWTFGRLTVAKSVSPEMVEAGTDAEVIYTVTIANVGDTGGALRTITDTLPAGLTFLGMVVPDSDVAANPVGTTGTLIWSGNWAMPPGQQLDLVYRVRANVPTGEHTNQVQVAADLLVVPRTPASATLTAEPGTLMEEYFDDPATGISRWTKFMNYWRLEEGQWYWGASQGVGGSGAATQDCWLGDRKVAEDALLMYLQPGAEEWTDYRLETKLLLRGGVTEKDGNIIVIEEGGYPVGLWVRGQYEDVGSADTGGWVTGYYIVIGGRPTSDTMFVRLSQLQTLTDCWDLACSNPHNLYDFNNPHALYEVKLNRSFKRYTWYTLAVEVRGDNIKVFFENELVIDYTDVKEPFLTGTVGFKTYKSKTVSFDNVIVTPLR